MDHLLDILQEVKVVELGTGFPTAIVGKMLAEFGAQVTRMEPPGGAFFYDYYPSYRALNSRKATFSFSQNELEEKLGSADIVIIGGESLPGQPPLPDPQRLRDENPRLIVVAIFGDATAPERPATELLAQARSGLVWEHTSERPIAFALPAASYGAALQAMIGLLSALIEREASGVGQCVETSLQQGALMWCGPLWYDVERGDIEELRVFPRPLRQLIFRCADERYVHLALATRGAMPKLYNILDLVDSDIDRIPGASDSGKAAKDFFGDIDLIQSRIGLISSSDLIRMLREQDLAAELVEKPGFVWDDPQVAHNVILDTTNDGDVYVGLPIAAETSKSSAAVQRSGRTNSSVGDKVVANAEAPLAGLKILDLGVFAAGPHASVPLVDLGADVIKVEMLAGDVIRDQPAGFLCLNRGKRSLAVDLKTPEGSAILRRACLAADVVIHNFRPGVSARMGVDAKALQALKPEIVVVEISGYGATGPKAGRPGFDMVFQAICGLEDRAAGGGFPLWTRFASVDLGTGTLATCAALLGLLAARQGKRPPAFFLNLLDTGLFLMSELIRKPDGGFKGAPPALPDLSGVRWAERLYKCLDGWIAVVVRGEEMGRALSEALNISIGGNPSLWSEREGDSISQALGRLEVSAAMNILEKKGVWAEICAPDTRQKAMKDPKLQELGIILSSSHSRYGVLRQIGSAFRLSRSTVRPSSRIPAIGEDGRSILEELGYGRSEIQALIEARVVVVP